MERVINKNFRKLRNLIVGINGYKLLILRKGNVLNINPTFRKSEYAFLFPFSIYRECQSQYESNTVNIKKITKIDS